MNYEDIVVDKRYWLETAYAGDHAVDYVKGFVRQRGRRPTPDEWQGEARELVEMDLARARATLAQITGLAIDDRVAEQLGRALFDRFCERCRQMLDWPDEDL